jgi:hypothetical protein
MDTMDISRLRLPQPGYRLASAFTLGLAMVAAGVSGPRHFDGTVSAQGLNACALLTVDEIEPLAGTSVTDGVSNSFEAFGYVACRYTWGAGTNRFKLDVIVNETPRMFPGTSADGIKQQLLGSVRAGTADVVIPEIGEAAVFKPDSPVFASAIAFVKGRILGVHLDGAFAREMKDQVVGLLKSAASRL